MARPAAAADGRATAAAAAARLPSSSAPTCPLASSPDAPLEQAQERKEAQPGPDPCDATLLAVAGVLDAAKTEGSLGGWIRAGGLRGPAGPPGADVIAENKGDKGGETPNAGTGAAAAAETLTVAPVNSPRAPMWFEHAPTVEVWVERGVGAWSTAVREPGRDTLEIETL
jgi:hypothetical protein